MSLMSERILVVEDEQVIAYEIQRRLSSFGYTVLGSVSTGVEAFEKAVKERPDLILMDIMLEGDLDGIETSRRLWVEYQIPTIFLTAYSDESTLDRAKEAQPLGYLIKPFKERELYTTIDLALYKARLDKKMRDQERWLAAILSSVGDAVIALDKDLNIHYVNPIAAQLLGGSAAQFQGLKPQEIFTLVDDDTMMPIRFLPPPGERADQNPVFFKQALLQLSDGQVIHIEGSLSRIQLDSLPIGQVLIFRDVTQLKHLSQKVEHQNRYDALTGLMNRKEFTYQLTKRFLSSESSLKPAVLMYLDLDQFKVINDTCGHLAGDELLRQTAEIIRRLKDNNVLAMSRLGGDEFAVLYDDLDLTQALERAWVLKHTLNSHDFLWQNNSFKIKASMGLIPVGAPFDDVKTILAAADDASYLAKEEGGNRIKVYETQDETFAKRRGEMRWINRLTRALETNGFTLYSQAIEPLDGSRGLVRKVELLIRLIDEDGTIFQPAEFLPAAERYNLMPQIDRWVIRTALSAYRPTLETRGEPTMFCINLSGESVADPNLVSFIKHEIKKHNLEPGSVCFEITETAAISNLEQAINFIKDLKSVGCLFALDDFGAGFSSFAYLKSLPVDYLKIDGIFVKNLDNDPISYAMVEASAKIGRVMGLQTIGEFAVNAAVLARLREIGIDYAQGYEVGRPEPLAALNTLEPAV